MSREECILMVYALLYDIRQDFAKRYKQRARLAKKLCLHISGEDFLHLSSTIDEYLKDADHYDGRYFRDEFPDGYMEMDNLHGLDKNLYNKSEEFQSMALKYLSYPEYIFFDYKEKNNK